MAADRAVAPEHSARAGNPLVVEPPGDCLRRAASGKLLEDPPYDLRFAWLDRARATLLAGYHTIPVAEAAAAPPRPHAPLEPAAGLVREVLEVQRVHGALQPYMEVADLALADGDQLHPEKSQPLKEGGNVLLIAGEPVERL